MKENGRGKGRDRLFKSTFIVFLMDFNGLMEGERSSLPSQSLSPVLHPFTLRGSGIQGNASVANGMMMIMLGIFYLAGAELYDIN